MAGRPYFAGQTDFAEDNSILIDGNISEARCDGGDDTKIDGGLVYRDSPDKIDEDIIAGQMESDALLKHGDEQRNSVYFHSLGRPPAGAEF